MVSKKAESAFYSAFLIDLCLVCSVTRLFVFVLILVLILVLIPVLFYLFFVLSSTGGRNRNTAPRPYLKPHSLDSLDNPLPSPASVLRGFSKSRGRGFPCHWALSWNLKVRRSCK